MNDRIERLTSQWDKLATLSKEKRDKLEQDSLQQEYDGGFVELDVKLVQMEQRVASPDHGQDAASVNELMVEHEVS